MSFKPKTLEELTGKSNFTTLIGHMHTGKYSTGHIDSHATSIIPPEAFSRIFCSRKEITSYCHLISTCAPKVLPCVLRFVLRQHNYPCEAITLRSRGKAFLVTDIGREVSDTVRMISECLNGSRTEQVRVILCFTQDKVDIETIDNSHDRFVIQVTGKTAWFSMHQFSHDAGKPMPACDPVNGFPASGIILDENDYMFLPAGKIFQSVPQTEKSLYIMFLFHNEDISRANISIKEQKQDNEPNIADCVSKFFYCSGKCGATDDGSDNDV